MKHLWVVERSPYGDDTNIIWGFAYIERQWPPRVKWLAFRNDGLPVRRLELGAIAVGWGMTHEWFCFERD